MYYLKMSKLHAQGRTQPPLQDISHTMETCIVRRKMVKGKQCCFLAIFIMYAFYLNYNLIVNIFQLNKLSHRHHLLPTPN